MKLDLETLKYVKLAFDIHSDHSTMCNGYRSLCKMIEETEDELNENFIQTPGITICRQYVPDNTTAMNCKYCGKSKLMHNQKW